MRYTSIICLVFILFSSCEKDKFTTAPQIKYKSIAPNAVTKGFIPDDQIPIITISVTDAEGDLGFLSGSDTAFVFIKNLLTNQSDSFRFPDLKSTAKKDFQGDIEIFTKSILNNNGGPGPKVDSIYFELYVKDFARNKSNVIITSGPVLFITP